MIVFLGISVSALDGYLLYMVAANVNSMMRAGKFRILIFILGVSIIPVTVKSIILLNPVSLLISAATTLLLLMLLFRFRRLNFFAWIIWMFFALASEFLTFIIFSFIPDMLLSAMIIDDNEYTVFAVLVSKFLQFIFVFAFTRIKRNKNSASLSLPQAMLFIISFPLLLCVMLNYYWSLAGMRISEAFVIFFAACIIAFLLTALYNADRIIKHAQEKGDFALMGMQISFFQETRSLVEKLREMEHDYRHHLQAMHALLDKELYKEADEYYNDVFNEFISLEFGFIDNQPVITSIFLRKLHYSKNSGVRFNISVPNRLDTGIKETDLCVIFSNILDNAFEACLKSESDRYVDFAVLIVNDTFFIEIENSTGDIVESNDGIFKSTKPDSLKHGYGLRSVYRLVSKYDGQIKIYPNISEKVFKISIALPLLDNSAVSLDT